MDLGRPLWGMLEHSNAGVGVWTDEQTRERIINSAHQGTCLASLSIRSGVVRDGYIWIELETEDNAHR